MKNSEYFLVRLIIIFGALLIGFFGSRIIGNLYYNRLMKEYAPLADFKDHYENQINRADDAYKVARLGMVFLKTDYSDLSLAAFRKATALDPKWRDGWVWLGYAELKNNPPAGGPQHALESLKTAEKIDPIYPLTYELLATAYQLTGDEQSAKFAREKVTYLSKSK